MTSSDELRRSKIISVMFGAYGQANDGQRQAIYAKVLQDIPPEVLNKAIKKLLLESKFLPAISEIVEATQSLIGTADDSSRVKSWDEAWGEIEAVMRSTPWGQEPKFSRPEIAVAVKGFGWNALQTCLAKDINTVRAQIRHMYDVACRRHAEQEHNLYVLGRKQDGPLLTGRGNNGSEKRYGIKNTPSGLAPLGFLLITKKAEEK